MNFFVLSGYLITTSIRNMIRRQRWQWRHYIFQRLTRLWIVLLPALCLGAFWDKTGQWLHPAYYLHPYRPASFRIWLGNLFYLQMIFVRTFGHNDPLWSLSYEFWYYILFPLLLFFYLYLKNKQAKKSGLCLIGAAMIAATISKLMLLLFVPWLAGAALAYGNRPIRSRAPHRLAGILFPLVFLSSIPGCAII